MATEALAWYRSLPFPSIHKVGVMVHLLLEWQEGREQREREPPRVTYERSLLAEDWKATVPHSPRLPVGIEYAKESQTVGEGGCSIIDL